MKLNYIRLALPRRLGLVQLWHWSVYRQISAARVGFLAWCGSLSLEYLFPRTNTDPTE